MKSWSLQCGWPSSYIYLILPRATSTERCSTYIQALATVDLTKASNMSWAPQPSYDSVQAVTDYITAPASTSDVGHFPSQPHPLTVTFGLEPKAPDFQLGHHSHRDQECCSFLFLAVLALYWKSLSRSFSSFSKKNINLDIFVWETKLFCFCTV